MRAAFGVLLSLLALSTVEGCKKKPRAGAQCTPDPPTLGSFRGACVNKGAALACIGGTYTEIKCAETPGCAEADGRVTCAQLADIGDPCIAKRFTCSRDKTKMLECGDNKWVLSKECRSASGCTEVGKEVQCPSSQGEPGDRCTTKNAGSCTADGGMLLVCDGVKLVIASTCRGKNKCRQVGNEIECDTSIAKVDDLCEQPNKPACDPDMKVLLLCDGKKFSVKEKCPKACSNANDVYRCD